VVPSASAFAINERGMHGHIIHIHAVRRLASPAHQEVQLQVLRRLASPAVTGIGGGYAGNMGTCAYIHEYAAAFSAS
jgi:hypothetical protein